MIEKFEGADCDNIECSYQIDFVISINGSQRKANLVVIKAREKDGWNDDDVSIERKKNPVMKDISRSVGPPARIS